MEPHERPASAPHREPGRKAGLASLITAVATGTVILVLLLGASSNEGTPGDRVAAPTRKGQTEAGHDPLSAQAPEIAPAPTEGRRRARHIPHPPPDDPFARLELLTHEKIARLKLSAEKGIDRWESARERNHPGSSLVREYHELYIRENVERQKAIVAELAKEHAHADDLTFGTQQERWFAERGAEMVRLESGGVLGVVLLQDGEYPQLVDARAQCVSSHDKVQRRKERLLGVKPGAESR